MDQRTSWVVFQKLQQGSAVLLSIFLMLAISGGGAIVCQGVAWFAMSQKAGGIRFITQVVFDEAPCHLCEAAQEMMRQQEESPNPSGSLRVELSKLALAEKLELTAPVLCRLQEGMRTPHQWWSLKEFIVELHPPPPKAWV